MKIRFKVEKKNLIWTAICAVIGIVMFAVTRYNIAALFLFTALAFVFGSLRFDIAEKPRLPWLYTGIFFVLGAIFTEWSVQTVILSPEFFVRLDRREHILNFFLILAFYFLIQAIVSRPSTSAMIAHGIMVVMAFVNYFVYTVRGNEVTFADVSTIGTGLSVASHYHFYLHDRGALIIMLTLLYFTLLHQFKSISFRRHWIQRIISAVLAVVLCMIVMGRTKNYETQTWEQKGSYQNGFVLNFAMSVRDSFVRPPEGYSEDMIKDLEKQYGNDAKAVQNVTTNKNVKNPTIIAIMDESFADLNVLGKLNLNIDDYMPFIHSMSKNTIRGYALSSVYGAKTPNSEWEYMTGNTMAFLPAGSVVYQQYIDNQPDSIVSTLKSMNYHTIAMHPYLAAGWRRNTVYPKLGFDEMYFLDDPKGYFDETKTLRKYVTDQELFDKIIDQYKNKDANENLFIMGITMQNHGGYTDYYPNFRTDVVEEPGIYSDANQYLTIARQTDEAVKNLITYFEKVKDPVEIVFFGDHQPSLQNAFYQQLNGKGMSGLTMNELEDFFKVPFFIWTNYDTDATTIDCTSFNFLSTMTLERANLQLPPYNKFLADLMQNIPAMNSRGYYSKTKGGFAHYEDASGEEAEWLQKYEALQYNSMFEKKKNKSTVFFPYGTSNIGKDGTNTAGGKDTKQNR